MLVIVFIKVDHFMLLGVFGVRNYSDYTFIQRFFPQNNLLSNKGKKDFSVIERKKKKFW